MLIKITLIIIILLKGKYTQKIFLQDRSVTVVVQENRCCSLVIDFFVPPKRNV